MKKMVIQSIHQVLDKFHISYDLYEDYIEKHYDFNLKSKNIFLDLFIDITNESVISKEEKLTTGSFYTPNEISNLIVEKTLSYYEESISDAKVADLSSGTGNLLFAYIEYINPKSDKELKLIVKNLFAYDLQWEPLLIYTNKMLLLFEEFPWELELNVNHGNTLETDIEETFDIILGNPPYIGEKNNKTFFRDIKKNKFGKKYYESKMDYYYFFMYKGWELLAPNGVMGVITTNYFFTADGANKLRKFIKENISFKEIINFHEKKLFKEALGQHNVITITSMKCNNRNVIIHNHDKIFEIKEMNLYSDNNYIQVYTDKKDYDLIDKIKKQSTFNLGDFFEIHQGIVSGADYLNEKKINLYQLERVETGQGVFVLTEEELSKYDLTDSKYLKRFYKNSDIDNFSINIKSNKYILYIDNEVELSETSKEYKYLEQFRPILESRREVIQGIRKWYALQWPREKNIFEVPKIVVPHRNICNKFAISLEDFYASADVYYIIPKTVVFDLRVIASILNSKLMYFWLFNIGKKKGNILELYSTPLKKIPIKYSDELLLANEKFDVKNFDNLNQAIYRMYNLNQEEIEEIEKFYNCMGTR